MLETWQTLSSENLYFYKLEHTYVNKFLVEGYVVMLLQKHSSQEDEPIIDLQKEEDIAMSSFSPELIEVINEEEEKTAQFKEYYSAFIFYVWSNCVKHFE